MGRQVGEPEITKSEIDQRRVPKEVVKELTEEEILEAKRLEILEEERRNAFNIEPFRYFAMSLVLGNEKLKTMGGRSELDGSSKFGGGALSVRIARPFGGGGWVPSSLSAHMDAHNFTTKQTVTQGTVESENSSVTKYRRIYFDVLPLFEVLNTEYGQLELGLGLGVFEIPLPSISDKETGESDFDSKFVYGAYFGAHYNYEVSKSLSMSLQLSAIPYAVGEVKSARNYQLQLGSEYFFSPTLFSNIAFLLRNESAKNNVDCLSGDDACHDKGEASSSIFAINLGIGIFF